MGVLDPYTARMPCLPHRRLTGAVPPWRGAPRARLSARVLPLLAALLLTAACGDDGAGTSGSPGDERPARVGAPAQDPSKRWSVPDIVDPPTARWQLVEDLRAQLEVPHHPSDGGGRVWLEQSYALEAAGEFEPREAVAARTPGRFVFRYEAGPQGIAPGGMLVFRVSLFWRWSAPWIRPLDGSVDPYHLASRFGLTEITTSAEGVELELIPVQMGVLAVLDEGGAGLTEGQTIEIVYGAGGAGARADAYAERKTPFWFEVDGDGDGLPGLVEDPALLDVSPGPAAQLVATITSSAAPEEPVRLTLAVLDATGSAGVPYEGALSFVDPPEALGLPERVSFTADELGRKTLDLQAQTEGIFRVLVEGETDPAGPGGARPLVALSNPLVVLDRAEPILWADLHGHSHVSDGTGTPEDYFRYARDVAALDVVALTDHDHWGTRKLDDDPATWGVIRDTVRRFHEPGRFVSLLGYEWTSWIHGHRHVVSFDAGEELEVYSSVDPDYETPRQLWEALDGTDTLTFAHHSAGDPIPVNWSFRPDPMREPVTEIVSVHGSSEARDSPRIVAGALDGHFVRDALDAGHRYGFIGSGDSHDGHPGLPHLANATGGLAALLTGDRTRGGVLEALRARRVYATSGARIVLRCSFDEHRMGSTIALDDDRGELVLLVHGTAPVDRVELVRSGHIVEGLTAGDDVLFDVSWRWALEGLQPGEYVYVRVIQQDGHMAWTSPFFFDEPTGG